MQALSAFLFRKRRQKIGPVAPWKPGDAFKMVTGKSIADCKTIDEVDAEVIRALKIKGPLPFASGSGTGFVVRSGDVFPHVADSAESISKRIDSAIEASQS